MPSSSSKAPYCKTGLGPAFCPEFPLIALFRFLGPLLSALRQIELLDDLPDGFTSDLWG